MKTILLIALQLAASGSDAYFTHRNQLLPRHYENNPIAAPFVHSTRGQVIFFGSWTGGRIAAQMLLKKRHHLQLSDSVALWGIADNTFGAAFSATH